MPPEERYAGPADEVLKSGGIVEFALTALDYAGIVTLADFVAELAANWLRLSETPAPERRVAIVLANYPNRDGRLGNGVGLDTPASTVNALKLLGETGYQIEGAPPDGAALMALALLAVLGAVTFVRRRRAGAGNPTGNSRPGAAPG